jgi:hypothetical protein
LTSESIAWLGAPALIGFLLAFRRGRTRIASAFLWLCLFTLLAPVAAQLDVALRPERYLGYEDTFAVGIPALAIASLGIMGLIGFALGWLVLKRKP